MESMRNYIFVSNESFEKLTAFYFNHLQTKQEKYEVFAQPINLLKLNSKRVVFLLEKDHTKNLDEIYRQISELNKIEVKSTIITEQIEETVLQKLSQLNAMVLLSEVPQEENYSHGEAEYTGGEKLKIEVLSKLKNYFTSLQHLLKKCSFEQALRRCRQNSYNLYTLINKKRLYK